MCGRSSRARPRTSRPRRPGAGTRPGSRPPAPWGGSSAAGELEEQTAREILLDAAAGHIGPDTTEREVVRDIDDGIAFGRKLPRTIRRGRGQT
ncbi:hypothetical protein [Pseudonocardia sp. T1-2H]|uniref:hypothetical protein n=1 Tax=Pseudonocardia sp. T1-2H TaxID=3128899 RepID=UPI003101249D